jgi:hypothetical protein
MSYLITFAATLAVLFTAQSLALRSVGGRTVKSESNFFSSIGRIQAGASSSPRVMLLGSSITGRLPDQAQGIEGWANMGCDGGSAVDVLRAMEEGILPTAPHLVVEANTLHLALMERPSEIAAAMRRPWFKVGLRVPNLAAYARPSAFLYSKLLARRTGGFEGMESATDLGETTRPEVAGEIPARGMSDREAGFAREVGGILQRLRAQGTAPTIVWLPPARGDGHDTPPWILELSRLADAPYWDLAAGARAGSVVLTDGVHMAASSAWMTVSSLRKHIGRIPPK